MSSDNYILFNWNSPLDVMETSNDKSFLEEVMCDEFMYDVYYDFYSECQMEDFDPDTDIHELANYVWDNMIDYYNEYIHIYAKEDRWF